MQAGGHRFDPGTLHSGSHCPASPCEQRGAFSFPALKCVVTDGVTQSLDRHRGELVEQRDRHCRRRPRWELGDIPGLSTLLPEGREDLAVAATELRGLATLIIRGLEQAGLATFTRDSAGKPIGLVIEASAHMVGTGKLTANVEVISAALESVTDQT